MKKESKNSTGRASHLSRVLPLLRLAENSLMVMKIRTGRLALASTKLSEHNSNYENLNKIRHALHVNFYPNFVQLFYLNLNTSSSKFGFIKWIGLRFI